MGMQSWRTSDTDRSITHVASGITFDVYMITRDGRIFHENDYFGYASFGGQDFFNLIAEMNGYKTRDEAIWAYFDMLKGKGDDNLIVPKFVEKLPSKNNWVAEFDKLPASPVCEHQGYFPGDDDEEIE